MTNLVQFPGLGLSFELSRVPSASAAWIFIGTASASPSASASHWSLRSAAARSSASTSDSMVDVILIGVVLGIASAACIMWRWHPIITIPSGMCWPSATAVWPSTAASSAPLCSAPGLQWRGVPVLPMFDLAGMGFLIGQGCGRWGNFFNQEAFGCNTTLPWGMFSEATEDYLMGSTVTVPKGVTIDPAMPVHPTFLYESIWCFVGLALLAAYIKKRKFNGDIALRYLVWYGAGRFWIEALRTDSLLLVPSLGLRASQLVAAAAVVGGVALEIFLTRKYKSKPLMVTLALTAENRSCWRRCARQSRNLRWRGRSWWLPAPASSSSSARMPITSG